MKIKTFLCGALTAGALALSFSSANATPLSLPLIDANWSDALFVRIPGLPGAPVSTNENDLLLQITQFSPNPPFPSVSSAVALTGPGGTVSDWIWFGDSYVRMASAPNFADVPISQFTSIIYLSENGQWQDIGVWFGQADRIYAYSDLDAPTATPLPAALPLFAGGLGLIGLLARRRKRRAGALAAA